MMTLAQKLQKYWNGDDPLDSVLQRAMGEETNRKATRQIRQHLSDEGVHALIDMLYGDERNIHADAAHLLGVILLKWKPELHPDAAAALTAVIRRPESIDDTRREAAQTLAYLGEVGCNALVDLLADPSQAVRSEAA